MLSVDERMEGGDWGFFFSFFLFIQEIRRMDEESMFIGLIFSWEEVVWYR